MAEIRIKNVAKSFGAFTALHSVDMTIQDQEFMVLLGASGCGKTTLLRIIAGLETPSAGEIWIGDRRVDHLPPRDRGIAMVFQNYAVFPISPCTRTSPLASGCRRCRKPRSNAGSIARPNSCTSSSFSSAIRASSPAASASALRSRALAMEPDVILMDEPLSNLDALLRLEMRAELKSVLAQSKTTTIYVTHDQVEAMSLADRIAVMNAGRIVKADNPTEVDRNPAARFVDSFIGNPPMNFLPARREGVDGWRVAGRVLRGPGGGRDHIEFGIRPEDVRLGADGFAAEVRVVGPLGPHTLVTADVEDSMFRALIESETAVVAGDRLSLTPEPSRIRWFDPKNSQAVQ